MHNWLEPVDAFFWGSARHELLIPYRSVWDGYFIPHTTNASPNINEIHLLELKKKLMVKTVLGVKEGHKDLAEVGSIGVVLGNSSEPVWVAAY